MNLRLSSRRSVTVVRDMISQMNPGGILVDHRIMQTSSESPADSTQARPSPELAVPVATHPVLSRLMEEVRNERHVEARYDRVHNRHNRGR